LSISPEDLDAAILDRCDESLFFPLPDFKCREKLLKHYYDINVRRIGIINRQVNNPSIYQKMIKALYHRFHRKDIQIKIQRDVMNEKQVKRISNITETFSGREIAKLMIAIQGATYASEDCSLTAKMVDEIVKIKVSDHKEKKENMCGMKESTINQSATVGK